MRTPVEYLRKSRVTSDRHVSWEVQDTQVRAIASRNGDLDRLVQLSDWNRSGRQSKTHLRTDYVKLLGMIEADEVSVVYAYSTSRLGRSVVEFLKLMTLCADHKVRIITVKDGEILGDSASARLYAGMLALLNQFLLEVSQENAADAISVRRARGDKLGQHGYGLDPKRPAEDIGLVVAAYQAAGSYQGAARHLNEAGVPTRRGGIWRSSSIQKILVNGAPGVIPPGRTRGAKGAPPHRLARLLRCHCGRFLTGLYQKPDRGHPHGQTRYICVAASGDPFHGAPHSVTEAQVMPWIVDEANRLRLPTDQVAQAKASDDERAHLLEKRKRAGRAYMDQALTQAEYDATLASIGRDLEALDMAGRVIAVAPEIRWDGEVSALNGMLRALFEYVELGQDLRPVRAEWREPLWREARLRVA